LTFKENRDKIAHGIEIGYYEKPPAQFISLRREGLNLLFEKE
jgi:hypothetical protein